MGFKCPLCKKDFGRNKNEWKNHISNVHHGIALDAVNSIKAATQENKEESQAQQPTNASQNG